jgi:hypothetical protein
MKKASAQLGKAKFLVGIGELSAYDFLVTFRNIAG